MNNTFSDCEKLYRAVFPASYIQMFWKKDGTISSAAFSDREGLSVERGNFRDDKNVIEEMRKFFKGCIISLTVGQCKTVDGFGIVLGKYIGLGVLGVWIAMVVDWAVRSICFCLRYRGSRWKNEVIK